jgi:hypothetical protein
MLLQRQKVKIVKLTAVASEAVEIEQILNMAMLMLRQCRKESDAEEVALSRGRCDGAVDRNMRALRLESRKWRDM